jgi:hypothetical protein
MRAAVGTVISRLMAENESNLANPMKYTVIAVLKRQ